MHSVMQGLKKTQQSLVPWLILLLVTLNSCVTTPTDPVTVYMGDPITSSIYGPIGKPNVSCKDPIFSQYICLTQKDFETLVQHK
jgi:hypothetical protein